LLLHATMSRHYFVLVAGFAVACEANPGIKDPARPPIRARSASADESPAISVPQNPVDRRIRHDLNVAIDSDPDLRDRAISFVVSNGDVTVSGTARTEKECRKISDLVMSISGVKSVANNVRVAE
jgi:osmotically-inducible protein OsmY